MAALTNCARTFDSAVVCEALRLRPARPLEARVTTVDIELGDGLVVPANTRVEAWLTHIHTDPAVWSEVSSH